PTEVGLSSSGNLRPILLRPVPLRKNAESRIFLHRSSGQYVDVEAFSESRFHAQIAAAVIRSRKRQEKESSRPPARHFLCRSRDRQSPFLRCRYDPQPRKGRSSAWPCDAIPKSQTQISPKTIHQKMLRVALATLINHRKGKLSKQ